MPLRFVRQAVANRTAQSLVLFVKFGTHMLAATAARSSVFAIISRKILARKSENVKRNKSLFDRKKRIR